MDGTRFIDDIGKTVSVLEQLSGIAAKFIPPAQPNVGTGLGNTKHGQNDGFIHSNAFSMTQEGKSIITLAGLVVTTGIIVYFTRNIK